MSVTLAAKLKLITTAEQAEHLRRTALAYRDALNYTSRAAYDWGKVSNTMRLQQLVYRDVRRQFRLSAQLACNVARQVGATYAELWTKAKQNAGHRAHGFTRKRNKGLDQPPKYVSLTTTFSYGYDYRFKSEQHVSITTLDGRLVLPYQGYTGHLDMIKAGRRFATEQQARGRRQVPQAGEQELTEHERRLDHAPLAQLGLPGEAESAGDRGRVTAEAVEEEPAEKIGVGGTFGAAKLWRDPRTKQ